MKKNELLLLAAVLLLCGAGLTPALAEEKSAEETKLESSASELEKDAAQPEGRRTVTERIKAEFGVDDARIEALREKKLGYGGVSIALSLAQGLPGGITDENVDKVVALRQGPPVMGWGKVAKELGLKLGPAVSKVKKLSADARKKAAAERAKAKAEGRKGGRPEKAGRPERPEKPERPAKPEKGGRP